MVATRFERAKERRAPGRFTGVLQRVHFSVSLAKAFVPAFADDLSRADHEGADQRIGLTVRGLALGELEGAVHPLLRFRGCHGFFSSLARNALMACQASSAACGSATPPSSGLAGFMKPCWLLGKTLISAFLSAFARALRKLVSVSSVMPTSLPAKIPRNGVLRLASKAASVTTRP